MLDYLILIFVFILLPLLISLSIFWIAFILRKIFGFKQQFTKKSFILFTVLICILLDPFFYMVIFSGQEYTPRAKVTEAVGLASGFKTGLAKYYEDNKNFNNLMITDFGDTVSGKYVENIWLSIPEGADNKTVVVYAKMRSTKDVDEVIQGKVYTLESLDGGNTWSCGENAKYRHENNIDNKYLPEICKNK